MDFLTQEECEVLRMWWRSLVIREQAVRSPLMAGTATDRSPLHNAAFRGRLRHMMSLVSNGYDVESVTLDNVSALHEACLGGHYNCIKYLLDNGANVDRITSDGATPLFYACSSGNAACVQLILENSSSLHTNENLASPIHEAAKRNHKKIVKLLLSWEAPIDLELPTVGTPLYAACMSQALDCVKLLLQSGADVRLGCGQDSPLHAAVRCGVPEIVMVLLDFGGDECCRNADGKTPLELSEENSEVRIALQSREACSLSQLCRVSIRRSLGRSRLHMISSLELPNRLKDYLVYQ